MYRRQPSLGCWGQITGTLSLIPIGSSKFEREEKTWNWLSLDPGGGKEALWYSMYCVFRLKCYIKGSNILYFTPSNQLVMWSWFHTWPLQSIGTYLPVYVYVCMYFKGMSNEF
jgi:hypothetical protein